jgi:3-isopropylmalate/(R)-2-methylmalate dehydratase small subunit
MTPINILTSTAVPLPLPNIDTDQIIPKQFLKRIERTGYGDFLFYDWRYIFDAQGNATVNPKFALNKARYRGSEILIAGKNFGCGSSREHAAWALYQYGFRCVIAPSFADIFRSNAGKNGLLLITLDEPLVNRLMELAANPDWSAFEFIDQPYSMQISLEEQRIDYPEGRNSSIGVHTNFEIDPFRKHCLLNGLDDIGLTLLHEDKLDAYEARHNAEFWSAPKAQGTA